MVQEEKICQEGEVVYQEEGGEIRGRGLNQVEGGRAKKKGMRKNGYELTKTMEMSQEE